jgi:hypothetical protein
MSRLSRLRLLTLAAAVALTPALALVPQGVVQTLPEASAAATCSQAGGGKQFYPGDGSSRVYNTTFHPSTSINHYLKTYVPQGVGVWPNWNGGTEDLFLVGMHHRDEEKHKAEKAQPQGLIYGISMTTGRVVGTALLPHGAHAGAVRTYKGWLYVQATPSLLVRYTLRSVRASFRSAGVQTLRGGVYQRVSRVSFFDIDGPFVYGGHFNANGRDTMLRYRISAAGKLVRDRTWAPRQVPRKAQGLVVLSNAYVFSTSSGRNEHSNIYVTRRSYTKNFETTRYTCFEAPVLAEGMVSYGGRTYLSFEGGADLFDGHFPWTTADNKIKNLHWASTETLRNKVW